MCMGHPNFEKMCWPKYGQILLNGRERTWKRNENSGSTMKRNRTSMVLHCRNCVMRKHSYVTCAEP